RRRRFFTHAALCAARAACGYDAGFPIRKDRIMTRNAAAGVLLALWLAPAASGQVPGAEEIRAATLANGMQVVVWPDHDIPNVAIYNWVRVGSRNEVPGIT